MNAVIEGFATENSPLSYGMPGAQGTRPISLLFRRNDFHVQSHGTYEKRNPLFYVQGRRSFKLSGLQWQVMNMQAHERRPSVCRMNVDPNKHSRVRHSKVELIFRIFLSNKN